jgi:hypothetical protein
MNQPLVLVEWLDIVGNDEKPWMTLKEAQGFTPAALKTVGFLIQETTDFVTICSTIGGEDVGNLNCLPRGCITSIKRLTV